VSAVATASVEESIVGAVPKGLFVDGEWVDAEGAGTLPVEDPATGAILCEIADASAGDALVALDAAVSAADSWRERAPRERGEILSRAFELIERRREQLALLMTLEMGKPLAESRAEVGYGAEFLRWFAEEAVRIEGRYGLAPDGGSRLLVTKAPVGPCLLITPWNFPWRWGPARSDLQSRPGARWSSSRRSRHRSRCSRWPTSSPSVRSPRRRWSETAPSPPPS
jgi:succinate-semialdehyde dehydrogenase / glutarate-semialdehyde dehydrogenase